MKPLSPLALQLQSDALLRRGLMHIASKGMRTASDAEDLFQDACLRSFEAEQEGQWAPGQGESAFRLVARHISNLGGNVRKGQRRDGERRVDLDDAEPPTSAPDPERALAERDATLARRRLIDRVCAELEAAGDVVARQFVHWNDQGVSGHAELAERIGCSVDEVRNARRRLQRVYDRVREQVPS